MKQNATGTVFISTIQFIYLLIGTYCYSLNIKISNKLVFKEQKLTFMCVNSHNKTLQMSEKRFIQIFSSKNFFYVGNFNFVYCLQVKGGGSALWKLA
jgi:hypothetical protein